MKAETIERLNYVCQYFVDLVGAIRADTDEAVATHDHIAVIKHYDQLRKATDQIKEAREALSQIRDKLSYEQVPEVMREHDVRTITVEGVGRVSLSDRWSCSMLDKYAGMDWLRGNGHDDLIIETVNSSTLGAFARNLTEEQGTELPSDLFKTSVMTYTSITKA
jgi:hypothetical protein